MTFAIIMLAVILCVVIAGSLLPQDSGIHYVYQSWWFYGPNFLLMASVLSCVSKRLRPVFRYAFAVPVIHRSEFYRVGATARELEAPFESVPDRGPWDWRVVTRLLSLCRRERVAIWHGHDYKSNALGLLLKRFWPMRLVTTVHGWVRRTARTPIYYRVDKFCLPLYQKVICVSDDLVAECRRAGVPRKRCVLLENGIDLPAYERTRSIADAKMVENTLEVASAKRAESVNIIRFGIPSAATK